MKIETTWKWTRRGFMLCHMNWSVKNLSGTREDVKAKLTANPKIPPTAVAAIAFEIDALPDYCSGARVDAFSQDHIARTPGNVTRNLQITIVGIHL